MAGRRSASAADWKIFGPSQARSSGSGTKAPCTGARLARLGSRWKARRVRASRARTRHTMGNMIRVNAIKGKDVKSVKGIAMDSKKGNAMKGNKSRV